MIITTNIRLSRILTLTWKIDLLLLLSCSIAYLADKYVILKFFQLPPLIPTVIGTALAFFIGFSNNQAYDRWWEARKVWGTIVNDSRSWARGLLAYCTPGNHDLETLKLIQQRMIYRHIGFLILLKNALRGYDNTDYSKYISVAELQELKDHSNKHNALLTYQSKDLQLLLDYGFIDGFKYLDLNQLIVKFCDEMGKSERIKNTVFPPTYHYFTRLFIWAFSVLVTIVATETTGKWSILLGSIVGFVFHTTHTIGMIHVNPFEHFLTGIPLEQITRTIEINLLQMMKEKEIPEVVKPVDGEYVL